MTTKKFEDKKITIREINKSDLKNAKKFQVFINSLIDEDVKILMNKKATAKEERAYVESVIKGIKNRKKVCLLAEYNNKIVGNTNIEQQNYKKNHIGRFGISIAKDYRGVGLGKYLMSEIIKLAKKRLSPKPRIILLEVYANNKPAINLYKKLGFKTVAKIPKQIQYKGKLITEFIMMREV